MWDSGLITIISLFILALLSASTYQLQQKQQQQQQQQLAGDLKPPLVLDLTDYAGKLPQRVILDIDGGVDDFITLMLLLSQPSKVQVLAVNIIDGDTIADVAVNTTIKLLHLLGYHDIPVALSTLKAANPFPNQYRAHVLSIDVLPILNQHNPADIAALRQRQLVEQPGQEYLAQLLLQQQEPVTVIMTGPLSNLAYALDKYPDTAGKVSRVWAMAGALRVPGNVYGQAASDGSAEWNAFWDPAAVGVVFNSSVPVTLVPLDGTNKVPITLDLLYSFGPQADYFYSALVGTLWAPVVSWIYATPTDPYCAWDTLTAACMLDGSELCEIEHDLPVSVVLSGPAQGATVLMTELLQPPHHCQHNMTATTLTQLMSKSSAAEQAAAQQQAAEQQAADVWSMQSSLGAAVEAVVGPAGHHSVAVDEVSSLGSSSSSSSSSSAGSSGSDRDSTTAGPAAVQLQQRSVSKPKLVSAVVDVDQLEFKRYLLRVFRQ